MYLFASSHENVVIFSSTLKTHGMASSVKVEFPLDTLVKWLSVYVVTGLASFLTSLQEFFKGKSSDSNSVVR